MQYFSAYTLIRLLYTLAYILQQYFLPLYIDSMHSHTNFCDEGLNHRFECSCDPIKHLKAKLSTQLAKEVGLFIYLSNCEFRSMWTSIVEGKLETANVRCVWLLTLINGFLNKVVQSANSIKCETPLKGCVFIPVVSLYRCLVAFLLFIYLLEHSGLYFRS